MQFVGEIGLLLEDSNTQRRRKFSVDDILEERFELNGDDYDGNDNKDDDWEEGAIISEGEEFLPRPLPMPDERFPELRLPLMPGANRDVCLLAEENCQQNLVFILFHTPHGIS